MIYWDRFFPLLNCEHHCWSESMKKFTGPFRFFILDHLPCMNSLINFDFSKTRKFNQISKIWSLFRNLKICPLLPKIWPPRQSFGLLNIQPFKLSCLLNHSTFHIQILSCLFWSGMFKHIRCLIWYIRVLIYRHLKNKCIHIFILKFIHCYCTIKLYGFSINILISLLLPNEIWKTLKNSTFQPN